MIAGKYLLYTNCYFFCVEMEKREEAQQPFTHTNKTKKIYSNY